MMNQSELEKDVYLRGLVFACSIKIDQDKDLQQFIRSFDAGSHKQEALIEFAMESLDALQETSYRKLTGEEFIFIIDTIVADYNLQ